MPCYFKLKDIGITMSGLWIIWFFQWTR